MKIKTIMCNSNAEFYKKHKNIRLKLESSEVDLYIVNLRKGPESLQTPLDEALAGPYILQEVRSAVDELCDAVVIDCAADPVLRAARQITSLPVISAGEASHHAAMLLSDKFSIITTVPESINMFRENVYKYKYGDRLASVRAIGLPVLDLENEEATLNALIQESQKAILEDGAEAIVLGCTGMLLVRDRLQEAIKIPVIEPYTMGVLFAVDMVRANLSSSPITYGKPSESTIEFLNIF